MHYYQHNINDYLASTTHLTLLEHGVYFRLIQYYYTNEAGFSKEDLTAVQRKLSIRSTDEQQAFKNVLTDFFDIVDGVYILSRCEEEIQAYHDKIEKASQAGKKSAEARRKTTKSKTSKAKEPTNVAQKGNDSTTNVLQSDNKIEQTFNDRSTDVELTNNHKPITNNHKPNKNTLEQWCGEFWKIYPRKQKKQQAEKSFMKVVRSESDYKKVMEGLSRQLDYLRSEHTREEKSYCPHASTWLNQERWEDEIRPLQPTKIAVGHDRLAVNQQWGNAKTKVLAATANAEDMI